MPITRTVAWKDFTIVGDRAGVPTLVCPDEGCTFRFTGEPRYTTSVNEFLDATLRHVTEHDEFLTRLTRDTEAVLSEVTRAVNQSLERRNS